MYIPRYYTVTSKKVSLVIYVSQPAVRYASKLGLKYACSVLGRPSLASSSYLVSAFWGPSRGRNLFLSRNIISYHSEPRGMKHGPCITHHRLQEQPFLKQLYPTFSSCPCICRIDRIVHCIFYGMELNSLKARVYTEKIHSWDIPQHTTPKRCVTSANTGGK